MTTKIRVFFFLSRSYFQDPIIRDHGVCAAQFNYLVDFSSLEMTEDVKVGDALKLVVKDKTLGKDGLPFEYLIQSHMFVPLPRLIL